jgi:hypothetical protein
MAVRRKWQGKRQEASVKQVIGLWCIFGFTLTPDITSLIFLPASLGASSDVRQNNLETSHRPTSSARGTRQTRPWLLAVAYQRRAVQAIIIVPRLSACCGNTLHRPTCCTTVDAPLGPPSSPYHSKSPWHRGYISSKAGPSSNSCALQASTAASRRSPKPCTVCATASHEKRRAARALIAPTDPLLESTSSTS